MNKISPTKQPGFEVVFKKAIRVGLGSSSEDRWLRRAFVLPFVPFIGLEISDTGGFTEVVDNLVWRVDSQMFVVYSEDRSIPNARLSGECCETVDEIVTSLFEDGWISVAEDQW